MREVGYFLGDMGLVGSEERSSWGSKSSCGVEVGFNCRREVPSVKGLARCAMYVLVG